MNAKLAAIRCLKLSGACLLIMLFSLVLMAFSKNAMYTVAIVILVGFSAFLGLLSIVFAIHTSRFAAILFWSAGTAVVTYINLAAGVAPELVVESSNAIYAILLLVVFIAQVGSRMKGLGQYHRTRQVEDDESLDSDRDSYFTPYECGTPYYSIYHSEIFK